MPNLINFDELQSNTLGTTLEQARKEVACELKMRRSAFARWARAEPSKAEKYKKQFQALAAVNDVLLTMTDEAWERRLRAAHSTTGDLFS